MDDAPKTCFFCGSSDLFRRKQTVAGEKLIVCNLCASHGRAACDADIAAGGSREFLRCQHLTAGALERELQLMGRFRTSRETRSLRRISAFLNASAFVLACACPRCSKLQVEHDGGTFDGPPVDIFKIDGRPVLTDLDQPEPSLQALRSMPKSVDAVAARKARNMQETVRPPLSGLGREVADIAAPWHKVGTVSANLVARVAAQVDDRARRHWAMVNKYGPGLRDGDYWLGRDGALVPLEAADRALPMTEADEWALQADRAKAARWQDDKLRPVLPSDPWGAG